MPTVGQGLQAGSSHPEGAPVGSGSHQARSPPTSLLQTRKIQALEELVETLEEHQGKRPSLQAWPAQPCTFPGVPAPPLGLVTPEHQGFRASG